MKAVADFSAGVNTENEHPKNGTIGVTGYTENDGNQRVIMVIGENDDGQQENDGNAEVDESSDERLFFAVSGDFFKVDDVVADGSSERGEGAVGAGIPRRNQPDDEDDGGGYA